MRKNVIFKCSIACLAILIVCLSVVYFTNGVSVKMIIAIFPTGTSDESYYFVFKDDGTLSVSIGTRKDDNINTVPFLKHSSEVSEKKISKQELQNLIKIANTLQDSGYNLKKQIVEDGWDATLLYNGKIYETNYGYSKSEVFQQLLDEIIKMSPLPIDLHGWA